MPLSPARKAEYFEKMVKLLDDYDRIFIVNVDNVGSKQMQQIRMKLRGTAEVLMGKNTMMRKVLNTYLKSHPGHPYEQLLATMRGNVGLVFTHGDLGEVRTLIEENRVPAPARVGAIAPIDVIVPAGPTGADPGQTSFFQVLQIPTKITKGQIEMTSDVQLIKKGEKVGNSEAMLLSKLDIKPFTYGLVIESVYDSGSLFAPAVLDLTQDVLLSRFMAGVSNIAAISLVLGMPTLASLPHSIANAFKKLLAITVQTDNYTFDKANAYKEYLADPSKFASAGGAGAGGAAPAAEEAKAVEESESEEEMGGMDMFGGGGSDY
jgi:large subunit ribosomal protein LP0